MYCTKCKMTMKCHPSLRKHARPKDFSDNFASIFLKFPFRAETFVIVLACVL